MRPKRKVNKEALSVLIKQHGLRETSAITGIPFGTLASWSRNGDFNSYKTNTTVTESAAASLQSRREKSALHLAKYAEDAGKRLAESEGELKHSAHFQRIAAGRANVFPEATPSTAIQVNVLGFAAIKLPEETSD